MEKIFNVGNLMKFPITPYSIPFIYIYITTSLVVKGKDNVLP